MSLIIAIINNRIPNANFNYFYFGEL